MTEQSEREACEAWARKERPSLMLRYGSMDGGYHFQDTHSAWLAWQAARASSPTYAAGWSAAVEAAARAGGIIDRAAKEIGHQVRVEIYSLAENTLESCHDKANDGGADDHEHGFLRGRLYEAKSASRALGSVLTDERIANILYAMLTGSALPAAATDGDAVERNAAVEIGRAMGREEAAKIVAIEAAKAGALSCEVETKDAKHFANGVASQYRQLAAAIRTAPPADAEALVERVAEAIASKVSVAVPLFQGPIVDGIEAAARAALSALGIGRV